MPRAALWIRRTLEARRAPLELVHEGLISHAAHKVDHDRSREPGGWNRECELRQQRRDESRMSSKRVRRTAPAELLLRYRLIGTTLPPLLIRLSFKRLLRFRD